MYSKHMAQNHINKNYCINIQYTNKRRNKMTKQEINFKLAMS